jgi:hypothetical protein
MTVCKERGAQRLTIPKKLLADYGAVSLIFFVGSSKREEGANILPQSFAWRELPVTGSNRMHPRQILSKLWRRDSASPFLPANVRFHFSYCSGAIERRLLK